MDKSPLTEEAIRKTAEALREETINRLSACVTLPSNQINSPHPKSLKLRRQLKRREALITCVVLLVVFGLSTWTHPVQWGLVVGCLCAGIGMAIGGLLERKGYIDFGVIAFLAATGLFVWSAAKFGAMGPMVWVQSLPLTGVGAFGLVYIFFDKFDFKIQDFVVRSEVR